ncbi:MAG: hypothetical protein ABEI13_03870 [Candidatus Paceibacteria bacterium]
MAKVLENVFEQARKEGERRYPNADDAQHMAFANSVAYLVSGWSGGYGGPSMREHLACRAKHDMVENCTIEQAMEAVDHICYGELTLDHARMLEGECCFDDSAEDLNQAYELLGWKNS